MAYEKMKKHVFKFVARLEMRGERKSLVLASLLTGK